MNLITRTFATSLLALALQPAFAAQAAQPAKPADTAVAAQAASTITTADGVQLYYKDWGPKDGPVVTFSHGWPLSSDSWESQMLFLASQGYRVVAHDRRGHGRSSQPWEGNDMDHYADDLAAVIEALDLKDVTLVGFSTGGGEVARYIGRHGTGRVKKAVLVSAVPPMMLKTADNPGGVPLEVFDGIRKASL
ncbi:MAG: alpha/beta fold hydrolase, partial [Pseudomonadaceae bacterium]